MKKATLKLQSHVPAGAGGVFLNMLQRGSSTSAAAGGGPPRAYVPTQLQQPAPGRAAVSGDGLAVSDSAASLLQSLRGNES